MPHSLSLDVEPFYVLHFPRFRSLLVASPQTNLFRLERGGLIENAELFLFEFDQLLLPVELNDERDDEDQERRAKRPRSLSRVHGQLSSQSRGVAPTQSHGFRALRLHRADVGGDLHSKRRRRAVDPEVSIEGFGRR